MIDAVLFDIGDTLVHFETSHPGELLAAATRPVHDRLVKLGLNPPSHARYLRRLRRAFVRAYVLSRLRRRELNLVKIFGRCHTRMGIRLPEETLFDLTRLSTTAMRRFMTLDSDALQTLSALTDAGLKLGLVSNTHFPSFAIDAYLEDVELLGFFKVRVYSSDVRYMKPHPRIFQKALERMEVEADHALYVGDRMDKDVVGASRVGMETVLLRRNGGAPSGRRRPDHVIQKLTELMVIVGR